MQQFLKKIMPASWSASMEKESREWMMRCADCGAETSVWDLGGIRWKAAGNPTRRMRCAKCGKISSHATYRKTSV